MKENIIGVDVKDIYWHAEFAEVRRRTWNSIVFTLIYIKLFRIRRLRRSGMPCDGWRGVSANTPHGSRGEDYDNVCGFQFNNMTYS